MTPSLRDLYLGDVRAEHDKKMLEVAFFESGDYRTLIETDQKTIVVGRRGTGKSALFFKLSEHFSAAAKTRVLRVAPDESEVLVFRNIVAGLCHDFRTARVVSRLVFRGALYLKVAVELVVRYKFKGSENAELLETLIEKFSARESTLFEISKRILRAAAGLKDDSDIIEKLVEVTGGASVRNALIEGFSVSNVSVVVLVDKTDEGYDPDWLGTAIIDGLAHAVIELRDQVESIKSILFLRDNIFRALAQHDPDYSRNIEQSVLRLHWSENELFSMICERLRLAAHIAAEKSQKIWDSLTADSLSGRDGFRHCLRLTLYRPRDLLLLLNAAFRLAGKDGGSRIAEKNIQDSAKDISENRLNDLFREYGEQFPGLAGLIGAFSGGQPTLSVEDAAARIREFIKSDTYEPVLQQQLALMREPKEVLRSLYSLGFIGLHEHTTGNFVFCHDGRNPDKELGDQSLILIHPCYWVALNLATKILGSEEAAGIYDEYDVIVASETPELRVRRIGQLEAELRDIEPGREAAHRFETWCFEVLRVLFAGALRNLELRPNASALQRRDIVGTNHGETKFWRRVLEDYRSRQVVFEIKNYADLGADEFRQMLSYLDNDYGKFAVIICRNEDAELRKDKELRWVRELYSSRRVVVLVVTAKMLCRWLNKLRSPVKSYVPDQAMNSLVDQYVRRYFGEAA